jgi:hypothetical protein
MDVDPNGMIRSLGIGAGNKPDHASVCSQSADQAMNRTFLVELKPVNSRVVEPR